MPRQLEFEFEYEANCYLRFLNFVEETQLRRITSLDFVGEYPAGHICYRRSIVYGQ